MSSDETKDLAVLYRIASLASSAADAASAQGQILTTIMGAFPADSGSLALLSPETGGLEIGVQQGLPPDVGEFALKPGQGITGWVARTGQPARVSDVRADPRYVAVNSKARSELAVPLATSRLFAPLTVVGSGMDCTRVPAEVYSSRKTAAPVFSRPAAPSPTR